MLPHEHPALQHHIINLVAIIAPLTSWLSQAPEFFTATVGALGTAWYVMIFTKEFLRWRRNHKSAEVNKNWRLDHKGDTHKE